jgi:hypothetical protein
MAGCSWAIPANPDRLRRCGVDREREVVLVLLPSWSKFKEPLRVSEASLRDIRKDERERALQEESDTQKRDLNN